MYYKKLILSRNAGTAWCQLMNQIFFYKTYSMRRDVYVFDYLKYFDIQILNFNVASDSSNESNRCFYVKIWICPSLV